MGNGNKKHNDSSSACTILISSPFEDIRDHLPALKQLPSHGRDEIYANSAKKPAKNWIKMVVYGGRDDTLLQLQQETSACIFVLSTSKKPSPPQEQVDQADKVDSSSAAPAANDASSAYKYNYEYDFVMNKVSVVLEYYERMPTLYNGILAKIPVVFLGVNTLQTAETYTDTEMINALHKMATDTAVRVTPDKVVQAANELDAKIPVWMYTSDFAQGVSWLEEKLHTSIDMSGGSSADKATTWFGSIHYWSNLNASGWK